MKKTIILLCLFTIVQHGFSCSCFSYESDFYKNISKSTHNCIAFLDSIDDNFEYEGHKLEAGYFTLIDTIGRFNSTIGETIVVTGQDGANCGASFYGFSKGDTLVLALFEGFYKAYQKDTFHLEGACGKYYQKITNGENSGLSLSQIKEKIKSVITSVSPIVGNTSVLFYPNPVTDNLIIESQTDLILSLKIYDMLGHLVLEAEKPGTKKLTIDISNYATGLYNVSIITDQGSVIKTVVKR